jgi:UDPglucose 6-dehydrogenase
LAEGSAIKNLLHPDRVLIGSVASVAGRLAAKRLGALYANWVPEERILYTNVWSSELSKLVANAMLAQRISSINSISALCERTGADVREITRAIGTDDRIGSKFLKSGLGFGGSCFRKDISSLVYISESLGLPDVAEYWRAVLTMNTFQRSRFTDKIVSRLNNTLNGKKVVLLGFAYKKDTGDTRESLAVDVIASLLEELPMEIAIFDPCCPEEGIRAAITHIPGSSERVRIYTDPYIASQGASAVAILTEWDFFKVERTMPILRKLPAKPVLSNAICGIADAPLEVFTPPQQMQCLPDCKLCTSGHTQALFEAGQRLDWARVAKNLRGPKYVIDGRGILDERSMKAAGLEVEGLGWGSFGQALF